MDDFDDSLSGDELSSPSRRVVCVDESCTGTMGPDGRCRVCGTVIQTGDALDTDAAGEPAAVAMEPEPDEYRSPPDGLTEPEALPEDDWQERRLCPDESCIGTLGQDGRCRVCGRSAGEE